MKQTILAFLVTAEITFIIIFILICSLDVDRKDELKMKRIILLFFGNLILGVFICIWVGLKYY